MRGNSCWKGKRVLLPEVVAAGLQQPHDRHESSLLELPWSRVGHGSSSPSWANKGAQTLYDLSIGNKNERS